jgi:hypothetical protein
MMAERRVAREALFYEFSLERHVPAIIFSARSSALSICGAVAENQSCDWIGSHAINQTAKRRDQWVSGSRLKIFFAP